ncbi:MAG: DUF4435 domain-containing protein [Rikenellaceae bacterium]
MKSKGKAQRITKGRLKRIEQKSLPSSIPTNDGQLLVQVFVEGYEDVAFWRSIFDHFTSPKARFEISVPTRRDLPKGKKVLLNMISNSSPTLLLCVDSDFDYIFGDTTPQSCEVNFSPYMFHTYTYATENYLCYAPSLHNVCVKATKVDYKIFDFESFMARYSQIIYPLFLWYTYSAKYSQDEHLVTLQEFKNHVKLNYLEIEGNGESTLQWVERNVNRAVSRLESDYPEHTEKIEPHAQELMMIGITPCQTYMFMHGHTLMDNVVMVCLNSVCEKLRQIAISRIASSSKEGTALQNEISNYKNTQRSIRDVLLDNVNYTDSPLYLMLHDDIQEYLTNLK